MTQQSNWEVNEISLLQDCNIHTVLSILIHKFQLSHGSLPEVIYLNSNCNMAFVMELIKVYSLPPQTAVLQPVWLSGFGKEIPLLYSSQLGEVYVQLINSKLKAIDTL